VRLDSDRKERKKPPRIHLKHAPKRAKKPSDQEMPRDERPAYCHTVPADICRPRKVDHCRVVASNITQDDCGVCYQYCSYQNIKAYDQSSTRLIRLCGRRSVYIRYPAPSGLFSFACCEAHLLLLRTANIAPYYMKLYGDVILLLRLSLSQSVRCSRYSPRNSFCTSIDGT
jgi:hypothetical protein